MKKCFVISSLILSIVGIFCSCSKSHPGHTCVCYVGYAGSKSVLKMDNLSLQKATDSCNGLNRGDTYCNLQ